MKSQPIIHIIRKPLAAVALTLLLSATQSNATQTVRELFDNLPKNLLISDGATIDGMTNDSTSVGLSSGFWTNNPPGGTGIGYKGSWTENWVLGGLQGNILPDSAGQNGLLNAYPGNLDTLIDPNTGLAYGRWSSQVYATHPLAPSAYVDFQVASTNWFSVRIEKNYSWAAGDSSAGIGVATGNGTNDHFVGFGVTRPGTVAADGMTSIGDTDYVTQGTLGQAGILGQDDTGGPYLPLAAGPAQLFNSGVGANPSAEAGLLVGRLITTPSGASELDVVTFLPNVAVSTVTTDPELIVWDATYSFTETNVMTQLLVWMHGPNLEYDAIRVGTSYSDVVGLELIGTPVASPANTVYAGTTVTVSQNAQVNSGNVPMSFQWFSNNVALVDATNASLTLSNTTTAFTADYDVVVSNFFGMLTSAPVHVTFLPTTPVFFTHKPSPITRYLGSPSAAFSCVVDGTPPYTYQWAHAGTNLGSPMTTFETTNVLSLPPITLADAGLYSVTVTNGYGATNSGDVSLTVTVPPAGSFAAALISYSDTLYGYWRLDDSPTALDPTIADQWGNHNGTVVDLNVPVYRAAASTFTGFPQPHLGMTITNSATCRVNLPKLPYWTNQMTIVMWVSDGGAQMCTMNAYGNGYGLYNNAGELIFEWAGLGAPSGGGGMDTGLQVPATGWSFVALVVEPSQASVYVGSDVSGLLSSTLPGLVNQTSDEAGDTAGLYPPGLGRLQYPWSEDGGGSPLNTRNGTWSDVAILFQSLTPEQVTNLFLAGVGTSFSLQYQTDGAGNLILNWPAGCTLQEADSVAGPYTDIGTATPPYSVLLTGTKFYRAKR